MHLPKSRNGSVNSMNNGTWKIGVLTALACLGFVALGAAPAEAIGAHGQITIVAGPVQCEASYDVDGSDVETSSSCA